MDRAGPGAGRAGTRRHPPPAPQAACRDLRRRPCRERGAVGRVCRLDARRANSAASAARQRAALRGPGRIFRPGSRPASQIQLVLVAAGCGQPGPGRSRGARRDLRARRAHRRPGSAGAGLRLGLALAVDGGRLSRQPHYGGVELALAARIHRRRGAAPGPRQPARADRRHERVRGAGALRPRGLGRDVRAHAQLAGAVPPGARLAHPARPLLHARVRPPRDALRFRRARRERLDEPEFLFRRHDAERRSRARFPGRPAPGAALALGRHPLRAHLERLARQPGRAPRRGVAAARACLRRPRRGTVVGALAHLLHVVRGAVRLRRGNALVGEPLLVRAARLSLAINIVAFQAGWFACVLGAACGWPWAGVAAAAAIVAWHVARAPRPGGELKLVGAAIVAGALADSALATSGWIQFAPQALADGLAPWWILAMWALFATTLNVSLRWLRERFALAAALGFLAGPLAYWGGAKLGAIELRQPGMALAALAFEWGLVLPGLLAAARRLDA